MFHRAKTTIVLRLKLLSLSKIYPSQAHMHVTRVSHQSDITPTGCPILQLVLWWLCHINYILYSKCEIKLMSLMKQVGWKSKIIIIYNNRLCNNKSVWILSVAVPVHVHVCVCAWACACVYLRFLLHRVYKMALSRLYIYNVAQIIPCNGLNFACLLLFHLW